MRVAASTLHGGAWFLRPFFWLQRRRYGVPLQAALVWARRPRLFLAVVALYRLIDGSRSPLAPALRALLMVRVSQLNGCRFCIDLNSVTVLNRGVGIDKLLAVETWRDSRLFTDDERAALAYAEAMTHQPDRISEAIHADLRQRFDDDAVVELTALVAFQNMSSKFNSALGIPSQGFCRRPDVAAPHVGARSVP